MQLLKQGLERRLAIVCCLALVGLAVWLPLSAAAAMITWACALGLAGLAAASRLLGRVG